MTKLSTKNNILSYLQMKESKCWYPSAGQDINAIKYWSIGLGNTLQPKLYIFTDNNYKFKENSILMGNEPIQIPEDFKVIECGVNVGFIRSMLDHEMEQKKSEVIEQALADPDIDPNFKVLAELGLLEDETISKTIPLPISDIEARYAILESPKCKILLVDASNEDFYNYCLTHQILISGLLLNRHLDENFFDHNLENEIIPRLNIQEAFINSGISIQKYSKLIATKTAWESFYNPNRTDLINYYQFDNTSKK